MSAKTFSLICASVSLAAIALPISINEWIKVDKYRRQRQAEIQRAADDAAERAFWDSPAGERKAEQIAEQERKREAEEMRKLSEPLPGSIYLSEKDGKFHRWKGSGVGQ